jgi:peptidyl-dipeptidase A
MRMEACGMRWVAVVALAVFGIGSRMVMAQDAATEANGGAEAEMASARAFIAEYEKTVRPLEIEARLADWKANASGKDEDFKASEEAQNRLDAALADTAKFAVLKGLRAELAKADGADPLVARQIELLYLQYLGRQVDPDLLKKMSAKSSAITQAFNVYRPEVDGKKLAESEVDQILKENRDTQYRKQVWTASKGVGKVVEKDLKELVALRNEAARKLGFDDYYDMELQRGEMSWAAVQGSQGADRREAGQGLRRQRGGVAAMALPGSVLPGSARCIWRGFRRVLQQSGRGQAGR